MRAHRRNLFAALLAAALAGPLPAAALAEDDAQERLSRIKQEIEQREAHRAALIREDEAIDRELRSLAKELVRLAGKIQRHEQTVTDLERRIDELLEQEKQRADALALRREQFVETLAALERLSQRPPILLLTRPAEATETVRSATLLGAVLPGLEARAQEIKRQIGDLNEVRALLGRERASLGEQLAGLSRDLGSLDELKQRRAARQRALAAESANEAARIAELAEEAKSLEDLVARLEKERRQRDLAREKGLALAPFSEAKGRLPLPARGQVVRNFGAKSEAGSSRGLHILTRAGAQVVAPFDGRVVFSGPFRDYGQLLIIEHSEGYHSLLAGMARIDSAVGQWVLAGEPVGVMAGENGPGKSRPGTSELSQAGAEPAQTAVESTQGFELYVELRRQGKPIDPLPWLAQGLGKVS